MLALEPTMSSYLDFIFKDPISKEGRLHRLWDERLHTTFRGLLFDPVEQ